MNIIDELFGKIEKLDIDELLNYYYNARKYIEENEKDSFWWGMKVINMHWVILMIKNEIKRRTK